MKTIDTILLTTQWGKEQISFEKIIRLDGVSNYTYFTLSDGRKVLSSKTLGHYETLLPSQFVRAHKSSIVNRLFVNNIFGCTIFLTDGSQIKIATRRYVAVKTKLA